MKYVSNSADQTQKIASQIAQKFKEKSGVVALVGELGAGKTTFTQGFAKALGVTDKIISPTFVLIRQHEIPGTSKRTLFHIDLYRLEGKIDIIQTGIKELFDYSNGNIILIEWAEKIKEKLPEDTLWLSFKKTSEKQRQIKTTNIYL